LRVVQIESFNAGKESWRDRSQYEFIKQAFEVPDIAMSRLCTKQIRDHLDSYLRKNGWATDFEVPRLPQLTITAKKEDLAFQIQTGNVSRYAYDLLKLESIYRSGNIAGACLAAPTRLAAKKINGNIATSERICNEMQLFKEIIQVPLLVISFED